MRVYGNIMNRIAESCKQTTPEVGMGATITMHSDRHAATIVAIEVFKSGPNKGTASRVTVQQDIAKRADKNGMSECQEYTYTPNPKAQVQEFTLRKSGSWQEVGGTSGLIIGERDEYYDFSF
jgi:hypothetical protein